MKRKHNEILTSGTLLQGVDVWKYIMALGVVAIHVSAGSCTGIPFPELFTWFIRLAVPFFFISSGFLLQREISSKPDSQKESFLRLRCKKILKLFSIWILIYLPISLIIFPYGDKPIYKLATSIVTGILIRGEIQYAWPLWFLYSLLLTTTGIWLSFRHKAFRAIFIFFVCLFYIFSPLFNCSEFIGQTHILQFVHKYLPIRAMAGGMGVLCGVLLYDIYKKIANVYYCVLFIVMSLLMYLYELPYYEMFGGIGIFLFSSFIKLNNKNLSYSLRIQSMWIYYLHMYIIFILVAVSNHRKIQLQLWPTYFSVLFIIIITAYLLSELQAKPHFKYLSFLTK